MSGKRRLGEGSAGRTDHSGHYASDSWGDLKQVGDGLWVQELVLSNGPNVTRTEPSQHRDRQKEVKCQVKL